MTSNLKPKKKPPYRRKKIYSDALSEISPEATEFRLYRVHISTFKRSENKLNRNEKIELSTFDKVILSSSYRFGIFYNIIIRSNGFGTLYLVKSDNIINSTNEFGALHLSYSRKRFREPNPFDRIIVLIIRILSKCINRELLAGRLIAIKLSIIAFLQTIFYFNYSLTIVSTSLNPFNSFGIRTMFFPLKEFDLDDLIHKFPFLSSIDLKSLKSILE